MLLDPPSPPLSLFAWQTKHYRDRRTTILRALGQSAFVNASQFALLWVKPDGEAECFASAAFVPKLAGWFPKPLLREAQAVASQARAEADDQQGLADGEEGEDREELFMDGRNFMDELWEGADPFGAGPVASTSQAGFKPHPLTRCGSNGSNSADFPLHPLMTPDTMHTFTPQQALRPLDPPTAPARLIPTTFSPTTLAAWYELRFAELGSKAGRVVAAQWIQAAEPLKDTACPYSGGEAAKPVWWPANVRHKEPDLLVQSEQTMLLVRLLTIGDPDALELSTTGAVDLIEQGKMALLRDIYTVVREERRAREENEGEPGFPRGRRGAVPAHSEPAS